MQKYKTRNELRNCLIESFSKESEIYSIYFFGKEIDNKTDEYSDIDMIICSNDLAKTQAKYLKILNDISPIIGSYLLNSTESDFSQMVMLKDFSPYQKIDLSITDSIETKISAGFGPFISIYKDNSLTTKVNSKLDIIKQDSVKNQLDNFLFTVPRFTKCLFRKDYDMYRRWKHISNYTMILLYEKYFGWEEKTSKQEVDVKELSKLNKVMSNDENEILNKIFPSSGIVNIAESYELCIVLLITLCKQKADYFKVELNEDFILHIERFLHSEITRYIKTIQ
ncbi:aminoglycoside 6-adenylyltransferase [Wukongibacter baidiensis]|uniref:hypothetical protein n=1 Tax=Wukongibacter baidiensis TaxID=1723361 RepID=UPI003D7FEDAF